MLNLQHLLPTRCAAQRHRTALSPHPAGVPQLEAQEAVSAIMRHVFTLHGAVSTASLPVGFAQEGIAADAACMLSAGGAQLALRHELRQPFVQWLARQAATTPGGVCLACLIGGPCSLKGFRTAVGV